MKKRFGLLLGILIILNLGIIIAQDITINSVEPTSTILGYPQEFEVNISAENISEIEKYEWDFGDGVNLTTSTNKATHIYNLTGTFELRIVVENLSAVFNISVSLPDKFINETIKDGLENIEKTKSQVENFSDFYQESVNAVIDFDGLEKKLTEIENDSASAAGADEYFGLMERLLDLKIPKAIFLSEIIKDSPFYPKEREINLEVVKEIGGGNYDSDIEEEYIDAISDWFIENIELEISNSEIVAKYEENEPLLNIFELEITEKNDLDKYYIILQDLDDLKFEENYSEEEVSDYIYISGGEKKIVFSTTQDFDFVDLPVFISPSLTEFEIVEPVCNEDGICDKNAGENWQNCEDCTSSWTIIGIIILILGIGFLGYIILQEWYKRKYESHLFKSRNSLYNIVQYINQAKNKGMEEKKIKANLRKAGWSGEQIRYAMRKYHGKRTGMIEIPNPFSKLKKLKIPKRNKQSIKKI